MEITARTAGNSIVEDAVLSARVRIERGETVAVPLKETRVFPPMVTQMIGVGEATGALDTMLAKIADFYEEEVDVAVAGLLTLLEPVLIAFLGGIVGGIVISMYLPIFDLISKLT
jgi:type IV pilus assembly protein PilC